ncbi:LamG-like jellyroll fold domain-containing protein [Yinghuangia seranimata]|uniref:LamG-like jellyroll fold domain-containing protein n=1 Tax=Yinghuangia seranimata TaxID=408067 RepID=UPI00248A9F8B|nr:LamG-like jellyroll fold domain-containing protein [Yinghuangia seranimata]MDI2131609.1 hypothetical protein [Yinghuangia seranimata]
MRRKHGLRIGARPRGSGRATLAALAALTVVCTAAPAANATSADGRNSARRADASNSAADSRAPGGDSANAARAEAVAAAEASASAEARRTGKPVAVEPTTTETKQVVANPDGTFTLHSYVRPVRVKKDGRWAPVDSTLRANADGTLSPVASTVDIAFSGGGEAPLVTLRHDGRSVALSWPNPLPAPRVSGSSALYPDVLPGVDLQVTADSDSYSEVLVVHDAAAAANPALAQLRLTASGSGLDLTVDADGGLSAKDPSGADVFRGSAPVMWDSRENPSGPKPSATDSGSGHVTKMPMTGKPGRNPKSVAGTAKQGSAQELTITPPAAALTGPDVVYPLYIDPWMSRGVEHWAMVWSNGYHWFDDNSQIARVGYDGWEDFKTSRSYFQMGTEDLVGKPVKAKLFNAYFYANEVWNAHACTAEPVQLKEAGVINSGTRWPGPEERLLDTQSSNAGGSSSCQANNVVFNAASGVQEAIDNGWGNLTVLLRAPDEGNKYQWKKFANNPHLDATFSYPPNNAYNLHVSNEVRCNGKVVTPDAFPRVYSTATDNNTPPLNVGLWFEVWPNGGSARTAWNPGAVVTPSGVEGGWNENENLGNGDWAFRTTVDNAPGSSTDLWSGSWTDWYWFTTRSVPPAQAPTVTSLDYPNGFWGQPQGTPGSFTLNTAGASTAVGFTYTFSGSGTERSLNNGDCDYNQTFGTSGGWVAANNGTASVVVPAGLGVGYHTLHVRSFDDAHNLSPESQQYTFYVGPNYGQAGNKLEAEDGATVTTGQPAGQNVPLETQTPCCGVTWSAGGQLWFKGTAKDQSFTMTVTAPVEGDYALGANMTKAPDYGRVQFRLDGVPVAATATTPFDGYNAGSVATAYQSLGGAHLTAGAHTLTVTLVGTNPASIDTKYMVGVDYLTVAPVNNVTASSFTAAMNNHGISDDNVTAADFDLAQGGRSLSKQALAAAGYASGSVVNIGGASFTMPAANANGNDNVIALGQTIPIPGGVKAGAVGLLTAATCGTTPDVTATATYTDGTTSNPVVPSVPDWTDTASWAATSLGYWDAGKTPDTARQPRLYALFLPVDPTKQLASVTLPNSGTSLRPNVCSRALHVLSMTTRPVDAGWIGTWAAPTDGAVTPPGGTGFADRTLREVVHPTVTGPQTRIRLSNAFVKTPSTIDDVRIAAQSGTGAAVLAAPAPLTFCRATGRPLGCGARSVTIPAGGELYSDPVDTPATTGGSGNLVVSLHVPTAVGSVPVHSGANTANYVAAGNATANTDGSGFSATPPNWYYLSAVDVSTADNTQGTVAVLGDQLSTTGAPGVAQQPTWVDDLPAKLGSNLPGGLVNVSQAGAPATGQWKLNEGTGSLARDVAGGRDATLTSGVTWSGEHGGSATFTPAGGYASPGGPVVDTTKSFTLSAWVKSNSPGRVVATQLGTRSSAFTLWNEGGDNTWRFAMSQADNDCWCYDQAISSTKAQSGVWTHLTGVFDADAKQLRLYVNGVLVGSTAHTSLWNATGRFQISGYQYQGAMSSYFDGGISDVRVYDRTLSADDIAALPGTPALSVATARGSADTRTGAVLEEPNLRTVIVALGANDLLAGTDVTTIKQQLTGLINTTGAKGLKQSRRTDGSLVQVVIATIPPLGLAPNDQRELNRQSLNNEIRNGFTNFGADHVLDLDAAVARAGAPEQTDPAYLTGGVPNDAYYQKLAQSLADAVTTFPPQAEL